MQVTKALIGALFVLLFGAVPSLAQAYVGVAVGPGTDNSMGRYGGSSQAIATFGFIGEPSPGRVNAGFAMEAGYVGPWAKPSSGSGVFSMNWSVLRLVGTRVVPFATAGIGCLCGDGFAVNYGVGVDYLLGDYQKWQEKVGAVRVEVRDYVLPFNSPVRHNAALRIGFLTFVPD